MDEALPGLADLVNELEHRLIGSSPGPGLPPAPAAAIPPAETYVMVLFDGLGSHQLDHPAARDLAASRAGSLAAPFPTTTTVALSTIATGLSPGEHGVIGHLLWLEDVGDVVNTLKWVTLKGRRLSMNTSGFLPHPNMWERLKAGGAEPITVQPANFQGTPLSRATYRGCRFEPVYDLTEMVDATVDLASTGGRLVLTYLPHVDVAAHVSGQRSDDYTAALRTVDDVWSRLRHRLPPSVVMVGTADHGHIDYSTDDKVLIRHPDYHGLVFYGDSRSLMARGSLDLIERLAGETGATMIPRSDLAGLLGPLDHPAIDTRLPDAVLLAPEGKLLLPRGFDKRLTGYHGGLDPREVEIPLLVASS